MIRTTPSQSGLNVGLLNIRSMRNKLLYIGELINEFRLDLLCLTETWLLESDISVIEASLPKTHSVLLVPRPLCMGGRGGGIAVVYSLAISNIKLSQPSLNLSAFECLEAVISKNRTVLRIAVIYRPSH